MKTGAATLTIIAAGLLHSPAFAAEVVHWDEGVGFNQTNRSAGSAPMGRLTVDNAVSITQIGILADLVRDSDLQFLIFNANTGTNLFTSSIQSFSDDGFSYKWSDPLSFTFLPGITYAVGASNSAGASYKLDELANEVGDFNFLTGNQNLIGSFGSSTLNQGTACCDVATAFRTGVVNGAVPEPSTWAMMLFGFFGIGGMVRSQRRRLKVTASYA